MVDTEQDRRRWDRIPLAMPLFVCGKDSDGQKFSDLTVARDIGGGGLFFASHRSLSRSARLTLQVPSAPWHTKLMGSRGTRTLKGRIVRVVPTESLNFYALQFSHPLTRERSKAREAQGLHSQSHSAVGRRAPHIDLSLSSQSRD